MVIKKIKVNRDVIKISIVIKLKMANTDLDKIRSYLYG